jgi:nitroreductase
MDFIELAKIRESIRSYSTRTVDKEMLLKILEAGRVAPTGANRQPQRLIVIQGDEGMARLKKAANTFHAPLVILVCADHKASWKRSYDRKDIADIDASIVTTHMMLQATELGLGSVWICHFDPAVIQKEFNLPDHVEPVNILAIGYAEGPGKPADRHKEERLPLKDIVSYGTYGNKVTD